MKRLLASLFLFITLTAGAEPFKLQFNTPNDNDTFIKYDEKEWDFVTRHDDWSLYLARGEADNYKGLIYLHTLIVYDEPKPSKMSNEMIHKIFNFGLVDCSSGKIFLLNDFFTNEDNKVVWISKYELGEFTADAAPRTPRGKVFSLLCEGKHI